MDESGNYSSEFNATGKSNVIPEALSSSNAAPDATLSNKEQRASASASAEIAAASAERSEQQQDLKASAPDDSDQDLDFENRQPEPASDAMMDATESIT